MFATLLAKFFQIDFPLNRFLVFARVIIAPVADGAFQADELF